MAQDKIDRIRELHSPIIPPEGMVLMGSVPGRQYCAGCDCGDPYLSVEWPCETRQICDGDEETRHIIHLRKKDYTIMHPLACRPNLFECTQPAPYNNTEYEMGTYYCSQDEYGNFVLEEECDAQFTS